MGSSGFKLGSLTPKVCINRKTFRDTSTKRFVMV